MKKQWVDNFVTGFGSVLSIARFPSYIYPTKSGFLEDRIQMKKDAVKVRKDLSTVTDTEYGKISFGKD